MFLVSEDPNKGTLSMNAKENIFHNASQNSNLNAYMNAKNANQNAKCKCDKCDMRSDQRARQRGDSWNSLGSLQMGPGLSMVEFVSNPNTNLSCAEQHGPFLC